jgi:hypothetical protein
LGELRLGTLVLSADETGCCLIAREGKDEKMVLAWSELRWIATAAAPALLLVHAPLPTRREVPSK